MQKKEDFFKKNKISHIDYRDVHILTRFLNTNGKLMSRKMTGCSAESQRKLENAVKRARYMALIPFVRQ